MKKYAIKYDNRLYSANTTYPFGAVAQEEPTIFNTKEEADAHRKSLAASFHMDENLFSVDEVA